MVEGVLEGLGSGRVREAFGYELFEVEELRFWKWEN